VSARQLNAMRGRAEHLHADEVFGPTDLLSRRRLRHVHSDRGPAEMAFFNRDDA